ncbi:MAG: histidine kinase, partial [Pseudomonadota bacterium]
NSSGAVVTTLLYSTFHLFALFSARATLTAEEAKEQSQALNRELLATQHLLSEASRQSERTRIARDLHDVVGHHLTALTINLQLAERLSSGEAKEKIERCHSISKLLLSDVRSAVSALREQAPVDFMSSLRLIAENVPGLQIDLDVDENLQLDDVEIAESLLRCVQEALTNTLRHTKATRSVLRMRRVDDSLRLSYTDNGVAQKVPAAGNGLTGMRERVERLDGEFRMDLVRGALSLDILIPAPA